VEASQVQDPWQLFESWYAEARAAELPLPEALMLATVGDGRPSARIVLYKGRSGSGLRFFTNYESRKARELVQTSFAAAVFHWAALGRQVRIEGQVEKLSGQESDEYFASRPRESQLAAWASQQSAVLTSRQALQSELSRVRERFGQGPVSRPPNWGGYRLTPENFEFWSASEHRLNERWLFTRLETGWRRSLLAP
jgi:pyridoxamine 5'-phosphate oxidase